MKYPLTGQDPKIRLLVMKLNRILIIQLQVKTILERMMETKLQMKLKNLKKEKSQKKKRLEALT